MVNFPKSIEYQRDWYSKNKTTDFRDLRDLYYKRKRERSLHSVRSMVPQNGNKGKRIFLMYLIAGAVIFSRLFR